MLPPTLEFTQPNEHALALFHFPYWSEQTKNPFLPPWMFRCFEYLIFYCLLFLMCVFIQFQKSPWLIRCWRILWTLICDRNYAVSVCAILTDIQFLWGYCCLHVPQLWYGLWMWMLCCQKLTSGEISAKAMNMRVACLLWMLWMLCCQKLTSS